MFPQAESPKLQGLLKRPRSASYDECDSKGPRPTKRHRQRPSTTPTPSNPLDQVLRPSRPQAAPPTPPESSQFLRKPKIEDGTPVPDSPNKRRIEAWLDGFRPRRNSCPHIIEIKDPDTEKGQRAFARKNSCPPRLESSDPDIGKGQRPLLKVLQEMSQAQSQKPRLGSGLASSARGSGVSTTHADYREVLRNNGVRLDHAGEQIPKELRSFLDSHILKDRSLKLSAGAIAAAVQTAVRIADKPESKIYDLTDTAMFPINRSDVGSGGNTLWYPDGLPRDRIYPIPLAAPKPDIHFGYPKDSTSDWKVAENAVIDHWAAKRLTQPGDGNSFPFLIFELKSEAKGGTIWQAENQAAGSGACCVSATRWLYQEAYPSEAPLVAESIAFSVSMTHRLAVFHVHFYMPEEKMHYMSRIAACDPLCQVQKSNHLVENIFEHCLGERQTKIRKALALLYPFPDRWKNSRSSSVMEAQNSADVSNKSQRME